MSTPPVVKLPVQVFPRPCEGAESFIIRLAEANYLKPTVLRAYLCDPPGYRSTLSWARLAAATGRSLLKLQGVLERTPPPSPTRLLCEYCGVPPKPGTEPQPPWWCTDRCRRRSGLLISAPSSRAVLPGQRSIISCITCGTRFVRSSRRSPDAETCSRNCRAKSVRTREAELALYENPGAIEHEAP
ncbi:hypothetical protein GCM10009759_78880 [Kitasatospora saccharophila]|uniref:TniQ protein n=1 Tax=Kitasatospora saccharophila TaxID=407973 RepID=A0ABP5K3Q2_9ACTN